MTAEKERDVLGRLADRGEEALHKLTELPGSSRVLKGFNELKARVDELSKKVRGIDALERRVSKLEKDLAAVKRGQAKPSASATRASGSRAKRKSTPGP